MIKFQQTLLIFLTFCITTNAFASSLVRMEVKTFDNNTFYIYYHDKQQEVNISAQGNLVTARLKFPSSIELIDQLNFRQHASLPKLSNDQKTITFNSSGKFVSSSIINGEKLTAIKFKDAINEEVIQKLEQKVINQHTVAYTRIGEDDQFSFDLAEKNIGAAAFVRGRHLWIVFDKFQKFNPPINRSFGKFLQLDNPDYSIIKIEISPEYIHAKALKVDRKWIFTLSKKTIVNSKKTIDFKILDGKDNVSILNNFNNNTVIDVYDPEIGDLLKVIPLKVVGSRIDKSYRSFNFNIIPSIQGVAVSISNDEVIFNKNKNSLDISSKHINNVVPVAVRSAAISKLSDSMKIGTLLPILNKKLDIADFNYNYGRLINNSSQTTNNYELFLSRVELAKFYFMHELYNESLAALNLARKANSREFSADPFTQFLLAVNNTLVGSLEQAKIIYNNLLSQLDVSEGQEISLWNNYNNLLIDNNKSIDFLSNIHKSINLYPDYLYWLLALGEIEECLRTNNLKEVENIFKQLRTPTGKIANSLKFYKANYYRKKEQTNLAKQLFSELASLDNDPFNKARAETDLIKLQIELQEMKLTEALTKLNDLRFYWRGDKLEYDILTLIATYYRDAGNNIEALRTYKYTQDAFHNKINNFYITSEMIKIFNNIFLNETTLYKLDPFTAVALFYEFKDLNPIGVEGDEVILSIAKLLIKLDLLDSATNLLQHQVNYRLTGQKRIITADHLIILLLLDKKPLKAIQVLDQTDKENFKYNEYEYRLRLKAKALIDLKKYSEAISILKNDKSYDAKILRNEALFRSEKWQDYIQLQEPYIHDIAAKIESDDVLVQDILRLAIAYYKLDNQSELQNLYSSLEHINHNLKNTIALMLANNAPIDYKNLDKSLNINQVQILLDKYKERIFN